MAKNMFFYCRKCPAATNRQHIIYDVPGQKRKRHVDAIWCPLRGELRELAAHVGCDWFENQLLAHREDLTRAIAAIDAMLPKLVDWMQQQREDGHA